MPTSMKLVAVSIVKNEADIIEAFVRHTCALVDHHLVFDHASTDGTRQILAELAREGLPLSLFTDDNLGNLQQERSNFLTRLAWADRQADWVLPLDADEILVTPDRAALERELAGCPAGRPLRVPLINYYPTSVDDAAEGNPVRRLRHRARAPLRTPKVFVPRDLAGDPAVSAGKGSHALYRSGQALPDHPASAECWLAHFSLRSPVQQILRVVTAELQKLGRGQAHAGLDVHYRLGFQLLAENPDRFFATVYQPPEHLQLLPVRYLGGPLRYAGKTAEPARLARALLPFLEQLARSHGDLSDLVSPKSDVTDSASQIRPLDVATVSSLAPSSPPFQGLTPLSGWEIEEGPFPEAFLPRFHWGTAPESRFLLPPGLRSNATLEIEALSYAESQIMTVLLNGTAVGQVPFPRVNQKESVRLPLALNAGENQLVLRYQTSLETPADPRRLAVIFLTLRVIPA
jgi:glycosyltransferase involved in cell wall biosynthesis